MRRSKTIVLLAAAVCPAAPASADTLHFRGVAAASCAFTAPVDGTIALQSDLMSWATATPATIVATNTAPATLTVTRPSSWQASPTGTPSTTFNHSATLTGVNLGSLLGSGAAKSGPLTALGATTVAVSLSGTATTPFPAGTYDAQVTVTCSVP